MLQTSIEEKRHWWLEGGYHVYGVMVLWYSYGHSLEGTNTGNLVSRMDDGWGTTLGPHQDNIDEVGRRRHRTHLFEVVDRHDESCVSIYSGLEVILSNSGGFNCLPKKKESTRKKDG